MASDRPSSPWNSLEVAKLFVTIFFAVVGALFTLITWRQQQISETRTETEEKFTKAAEMRTAVWTQAAPMLNDIYAYFVFVGDFEDLDPKTILDEKAKVDRLMWSNRVLFAKDSFDAYTAFINAAFNTHTGWLKKPSLRTVPIRGDKDKNATDVEFTSEDNRACINKSYWALQSVVAKELDLPNPGIASVTDPVKQMNYGRKMPSSACETK
jgi:hypothetical protein